MSETDGLKTTVGPKLGWFRDGRLIVRDRVHRTIIQVIPASGDGARMLEIVADETVVFRQRMSASMAAELAALLTD